MSEGKDYIIQVSCRDRFLHESLKNIANYTSVSQSLKILRKLVGTQAFQYYLIHILEAYGEYGAHRESDIIDKLHTTYDLLKLSFNELLHYKQTLGKQVVELRSSSKVVVYPNYIIFTGF